MFTRHVVTLPTGVTIALRADPKPRSREGREALFLLF
jgi:hypothetical protein